MTKLDFARRYLDAWNAMDITAIEEHLHPNCIYIDISAGRTLTSQELIKSALEEFESDPCRYEIHGEVIAVNDCLSFQYREYTMPQNKKSRDVEVSIGAKHLTLRDGMAIQIFEYYETKDFVEGYQQKPSIEHSNEGVSRYRKTGLSRSEMKSIILKIEDLMAAEKLYLDSDISLPIFSKRLGHSVNHVSQTINLGMGVKFFEYINTLRIQDAIRIMESNNGPPLKVMPLGMQVGFRNASTFYSAFRKVTGESPASYQQLIRSKSC